MTYIVRDCTVNPPRILVEIHEEDEPPFNSKPQIKTPYLQRSSRLAYWVIAAMVSVFTMGAMKLFLE